MDANTYFSSLLFLGQAFLDEFPNEGDPAVRAIFEVTASKGQSVGYGLAAVVVPEPSTALLLGIGLALTATLRRSRS